jgi:hypothetical protein
MMTPNVFKCFVRSWDELRLQTYGPPIGSADDENLALEAEGAMERLASSIAAHRASDMSEIELKLYMLEAIAMEHHPSYGHLAASVLRDLNALKT